MRPAEGPVRAGFFDACGLELTRLARSARTMTDTPPPAARPQSWPQWGTETQLVHGGILRSAFAETSEALFLTQSYVYDSAEQAEERFKNEAGGFIYSRYANPTVAMFEERMRLLEGAG